MADFFYQIDDEMMEAAKSLLELSIFRDSFISEYGFVENGAKKLNSQDLGEHSRKKRIRIIKKNFDDHLDFDHKISRKKRKRKYECNVCKRTFKSHQALGGHMACHRKDGQKGSEDSNSFENKPANTTGFKRIKIINFGKSKREEDGENDLEDLNSLENSRLILQDLRELKSLILANPKEKKMVKKAQKILIVQKISRLIQQVLEELKSLILANSKVKKMVKRA
ncbi:unnamed protein product [Amaranthus hypochondriacus]